MKGINETFAGEGITLHKIERFLFQQVISESGDVSAAAHITGQGHYLANVAIFYSTLNLNHLRKVYLKTLKPVLRDLHSDHDIQLKEAKKSYRYVGARHCVTLSSYQEAIIKTQDDIKLIEGFTDWDGFVEFHNLYTFHTVLWFGFCAAIRAIKHPLITPESIDRTGLSTYSDKDTVPPYHARLIWVPELMKIQLESYANHLAETTAWLQLKFPNKAYPERLHPCYFIGGESNNNMQVVKPSTLRPFYSKYIDVPANAHRRFLRTELVERGMAIESINALMGHWSNGEEPWGMFSSFHLPEHLENLKKYLEPLLAELGFKVVGTRPDLLQ